MNRNFSDYNVSKILTVSYLKLTFRPMLIMK